jgi:uncharacterized protein (DUF433 family)
MISAFATIEIPLRSVSEKHVCDVAGQDGTPNRWRTLDLVYVVNDDAAMATIVQSCRIAEEHATLLSRQAKRRNIEVSTLSSLYLKEKALEEEFPGIGFRDSVDGREAFVLGHRMAVWEVVTVHEQARTVTKTAAYFRWPPALVRSALAYAAAHPTEVDRQRSVEIGV